MIAAKDQLVRLTAVTCRNLATLSEHVTHPYGIVEARVTEIVYTDQPPGQRGVRLARPLGGETWWMEIDLEAAE